MNKLLIFLALVLVLVGCVYTYDTISTEDLVNEGIVEGASGVVDKVAHYRNGELIFVDKKVNDNYVRYSNG
jgi:uncharacterized membrane protein YjdF